MADPQIIWFRQDLRLRDQPAVRAAAAAGPVIAVYVLDEESPGVRAIGAASRWWLHHSLQALDAQLRDKGGELLLLRGGAAACLRDLAEQTGANAIHAISEGEPWWPAIEAAIPGLVLHEGSTLVPTGLLRTGAGEPFRVFTPFWRALQAHGGPPRPKPAPRTLAIAPHPQGELLADWKLLPRNPDWSAGFREWQPGEAGAQARIDDFLPRIGDYPNERNCPSRDGTSRLSPHLHFGEISPADCWHAAAHHGGKRALSWQRQLAWRDFGHENLAMFPDSATDPHRPAFGRMPWTDTGSGEGRAHLLAWQQGRTGYPLVDAGMRQLWETGWMHNRVRMVTASFLTKHLLIRWQTGEEWFWDTLVDADSANNAMGWQWVMGSGVDSSPYYRIFAPLVQSAKFEAAAYIRRFVPELRGLDDKSIHGPFEHGHEGYPAPIVDHAAARQRALAAYAAIRD